MIIEKTNEESVETITDLSTAIGQISLFLLDFQKRLCSALEAEEKHATFKPDPWQYPQGGGGVSCVLENGQVLEKAGVNFSHVLGQTLPKAATLKRPDLANAKFQAVGVSSVIHPLNPFIPTSHLNVRFIAVEKADGQVAWWFGGGFDLTPYYGFAEDCKHWHRTAKDACDPFGDDVYSRYKKWCDDYFFLPHRNEPRGIGGIFFDDLNAGGFARCFAFMQSVGNAFIKAYLPIVAKRKTIPFTEQHKDFQHYRRGRYVEFNLLYDRGTLFGLQSGGRTESILMSLPPHVTWHYNWQPETNTPEAKLYQEFLLPRDWL